MGRRRGGGGAGKPRPSSLEQTLRRRIESVKHKYPTADDIATHLRSTVPQYNRLPNFTAIVERTLKHLRPDKPASTSSPEPPFFIEDSDDSPVRKRSRRRGGDAMSSSSSSDSEETDESDVEPEFDVTKSMLRESYQKVATVLKSDGKAPKRTDLTDSNDGVALKSGSKTPKRIDLSHLTDSTDDDTVLDSAKSKKVMKRDKNVEIEVVSNSNNVKTPKKGDLLRKNEKGTSKEGKDLGGPRFKDLGGMSEIIEGLKSEVLFPLFNPEMLRKLGVNPIKGILLKGPPGCGKTKLAHAVANEAGVPFYKIAATELISGVSGSSEENIRELFAKAYRTAPSIVFIDEIDVIGSKRENQQREMERRIVTQLMTCMDESHKATQSSDNNSNPSGKSDYVLVIGATNRPDSLDSALRRPGRFDREITLNVPDEKARLEILSVLVANLKVEGENSFDLLKIARSTPGFVGADLAALVNKAGNLAMKRISDRRKNELSKEPLQGEDWWTFPLSAQEMENLSITMADFEEAATLVQPSSRREGFSSVPNVKWEDVGGLPELRKEFDRYIVNPIKNPDFYANVDLDFGFLLYGPPGCGKTLIAKAVANEAGANFIHIKGPELLNKYVGESELAVRTLFSRARTCAPCILFFDEVDALTANGDTEGGGVVSRLLRQLMIELSGSDERRNVFLIGATNRPEVMDRALFRNERFGKLMHVTLPNEDERGSILTALARKKDMDASVDLIAIGRDEACKNLSGADLSALMNEAAMLSAEERRRLTTESSSSDATLWSVKKEHFEQALKKISPSVSEEQKHHYYLFEQSLKAA